MKKWYEIVNKAEETEILIYGAIGGGMFEEGIEAKKFIQDFKNIKSDSVTLRINSPGGSVFEGLAIYNYLISSGKNITTINDGFAASIASILFLVGEKRIAAKASQVMIHNPMGFVGGDSTEMKKMAEVLEGIKTMLVDIYTDRTNLDSKTAGKLMDKETWLKADEALEMGFATDINEALKIAACADLEKFSYTNKIPAFEEPKKQEANMEKIFAALQVMNEAEAFDKINAVNSEIVNYKQEIKTLKDENEILLKLVNEEKITRLIAEGKILESQKDFANRLITDSDLFNAWLETNKRPEAPTEPLKIQNNQEAGEDSGII